MLLYVEDRGKTVMVWTYRENRTYIAEKRNSLDCILVWPSSVFTFQLTSVHVGINQCVFFLIQIHC